MRTQEAAREPIRAPANAPALPRRLRRPCAAPLLALLALHGCAPGAGAAGQGARPTAAGSPALAPLPEGSEAVRVGEALVVRRVARDAYVVTHDAGIVPANVLVARMPDGTLVICSSPYDTGTTQAMVRWLRDAFRPPRMVAINTHFHPDGTAGNEAYREAGVETYASNLTQDLLMARGRAVQDQTARAVGSPLREPMERTRTVPAKHTFDAQKGLELELGGEPVRVLYPGPAHTPDNVAVFFPARRLLYGGDVVRAAEAGIGYRGDADVERWEAAIQALEPLAPLVVVPGHGAPGGPELLQHTRDVARAAVKRDRGEP